MAIITLAADATTLVLNGTAIIDTPAGDTITLAPVSPSTGRNNAINGGVNINERSDKGVHDVTVRVQKYSESDSFLNNLERQSPPSVINGSAKTAYSRDGQESEQSWLLEGGSFTTKPTDTHNDTDGNAVMEYVIQFRSASRNL
jgi:hypothetical protein